MKKRILSIVLSIVMLVSLLPTVALASGTGHEGHTCSDSCGHIDGDPHTTVAMSAWSNTGSLPNAGNYYLTVDVEISSTWTPTGNVTLCLNGKSITMTGADNVIKITSGVTFTLTDCGTETKGTITHSEGVNGHGVYVSGGTFNMYGGSISGNTVNGTHGPGVYVSSGEFNMYGGTISGNSDIGGSGKGGGVYVYSGTFTMTGGTISENTANNGGGVCINGGTFNISGNPKITDNKNKSGNTEDIYLGEDANPITIVGALNNSKSISIRKYNYTGIFAAPGDGVTLTAADAGKFTSSNANYNVVFSDGKLVLVNPASHPICGATCTHSGAHENINWTAWDDSINLPTSAGNYYLTENVEIASTWQPADGTFLCLNGHKITMTGSGDVIEAKNFTLTDCRTTQGEITHSSEATGSGVKVNGGGTFNMYGGCITGNINSGNGGGVEVDYGTFNMYGGSITNNKVSSDHNGGGVYIDYQTIFNMYGGTISGNTAPGGGGVYVRYNKGTFNMYGGTISGNTATLYGGGVYVFDTTSVFNISGNPVITGNTVGGRADNVYLPSGVTITVNGALTGGNNSIGVKMDEPGVFAKPDGTSVTMLTAADAAKFTSDDDGYVPAADSGNLKLVVPPHSHYNCGEKNCEDSAHTHSSHGNVDSWTELTKENIKTYVIKSGSSYILTPGSYYLGEDITLSDVANDCTFIYMNASRTYNVCLNGNTITGSGSAPVFRANDTNAVLSICDCSKPSTGKITGGKNGGVYIDDGTVNLYGGSITGNTVYQQGAGVYVSSGTFNMYGGSITNNTFTSGSDRKGGGVYVSSGTFNMYGGTISDHVSSDGGGVYVASGTFNMSGTAAISGNSASSQGGGVYVYSGTFTMTGGEITGNSANNNSGGVHNWGGTFNVSGSPVVTDNKVGTAENNIYCANDITIIGALTADAQIGVNYYTETTFTSGWNTYMTGKEENIYEYFTPDDSAKYGIRETDGKLELYLLHEHGGWTYSYADGTITATCGVAGCTLPNGKATYQLNVTENTKYSESYTCPISANGSWTGANAGTVVVIDNGLNNDLTNGLKGTATIKVNDTTVTTEATYTLQKADNAFTTAPAAIEDLTYTGEAQALITGGTGAQGTVKYSLDNSTWSTEIPTAINRGDYTVYYKVEGGVYYEDIIAAEPIAASIGWATPTVTAPTAKTGLIYNGNDQALVIEGSTSTGCTMWYIASEEQYIPLEDAVWSTEVPTAKNATTHYVWYKVVGNDNYKDVDAVGSEYIAVTIAKANINPTVSIDSWVYGQSANAPSVTGNTGNGTVTYYYKAQDADDNTYTTAVPSEVGNYTVKAAIAETGNYNGASATADFSIAYASMTAQDAFGYIYDADVWANADITFTAKNGYTVSTEANGTYGSGITFSDEGEGVTKTVYVREDSTGKIAQVELKYNLDKTAPGISAVSGNPDNWTKDNAVISFTAEDAPSDVASVVVTCDDGEDVAYDTDSFTADRNGTYTITVTDKAGNAVTKTVTVSKIDKAAPSLRIGVPTGTDGNDGWFTSAVTVPVTAGDGDGESGLDKWYYSLNGGTNWTEGSNGSFVISADGDYNQTVKIKAVDMAGNETVTTIAQVKVDTTAPGSVSVTAKVGEDDYVSGSDNRGDVVITLTGGEDATSGFDKYQYKIGAEGSWQDIVDSTYTHTASTVAGGVTYTFRAVDKAGNASVEVPFTVKKAFPVRFNANIDGVTGTMEDTYIYQNGAVVMPACGFAKPGYSFVGWYTSADCTGECYREGNELTNITESAGGGFDLYAKWQIDEYSVTINLNGAGAEGPADATYTVESDDITIANPTRTGYTFKGWSGTGLAEATMTVTIPTGSTGDRTYTANWTVNEYTVKFDANGGEGEMADQSFTYDAAQALTENAFTREGYKFVGWAETADGTGVDYVGGQQVLNLTAENNGDVTLYAVWTRDIILSGDISAANVPIDKLSVILRGLDGTKYAASVTGTESPYHYTVTVPEGEYQLVVKDTRDGGVTVTAKEELTEDKTENIFMPAGNRSSIVDSTDAGDYKPIVGGLDEIAAAVTDDPTDTVTVTLTVTHEESDDNDQEHIALMTEAGAQKSKLTFLEIDLEKNVNTVISSITETDNVIEIIVPFDTTRKQNFKVYRFHDYNGNDIVDEDEVDILTTTANDDGEYIEVGTGSVTIHAKFFSLYAIGYNDVIPYYPVTHSCTSKCDVCGGCEDAACTESACKDKCRLLGMNFTDVAEGKWYTEAVEYVYHHKMMEGVGNNLFDINGTTTRAMIVTILWRLEGEPVVNYLMQFDDIPADTWYTEAVRWAASEKIVEGYSDTAFGPTDPITREQFATILWRYAKYKGYDVSVGEDTNILSYNDAFSVSEWAIPAMQWACGAGLMQGDGVNLTPKADATRAQAAALFQRFCENVAEK